MPSKFELEEASALYKVVNGWVLSAKGQGYQEGFFELACELSALLKQQIEFLENKSLAGADSPSAPYESTKFTENLLRNRHRILLLNERISHIPTFRPWRQEAKNSKK